MKTGVSYGANGSLAEIRTHLERLRRAGFDCVDLGAFLRTENDWFTCSAAEFERRCAEVRRMARELGLEFPQTHGPWRWPPRDLTQEDREERFEKMARSLEGTAAVGAPCMAIHNIMPFGTGRPEETEDPTSERFMEMNRVFYARLLERAKACGVAIAL